MIRHFANLGLERLARKHDGVAPVGNKQAPILDTNVSGQPGFCCLWTSRTSPERSSMNMREVTASCQTT